MGEDEYYNEAVDALRQAQLKYNELKEKGLNYESELISKAKEAMDKGNYDKAFEYAVKYIEEMEYIESQPRTKPMPEEEVETAKITSVHKLPSKLTTEEEEAETTKTTQLDKLLAKPTTIEDSGERELYLNLLKRMLLTEELANEAPLFGLDGSKCLTVIEEAIEALRKKNYDEAREWLNVADRLLPYIKFPYYHGVEMEIQLVKKNGKWIEGERLEDVFSTIVLDSKDALEEILSKEDIPKLIKEPVKEIYIQNIVKPGHNRGLVVTMKYRVDDRVIDIEMIGRDAHGSGVTWILEIASPPCRYAQQLDWWLHTLFKICYEAVKKHPNVILTSSGINPVEPFSEGFSFGDHHHIGIPEWEDRRNAYNLLRNYIPYLVGLSVNSPIVNGNIPNITISPSNIIFLQSLTDPLSIRLKVNQRQLGPNDETRYIPYLRKGDDVEMFRKSVGYATIYDARFVDIFPFTRFNTIEIRIFDSQLVPRDRVSMAMLLQAIALKGVREGKMGSVAEVSARAIVKNRERAILKGLMMGIYTDKDLKRKDSNFSEIYQEKKILIDGKETSDDKLHYTIEGCRNMLWYIREELLSMGGLPVNYLTTHLITLFGGDRGFLSPPLTPSQFQIYILENKCNRDINLFVSYIQDISRKVCEDINYNPMVEVFGMPKTPEQLKNLWRENNNKG